MKTHDHANLFFLQTDIQKKKKKIKIKKERVLGKTICLRNKLTFILTLYKKMKWFFLDAVIQTVLTLVKKKANW